MLKLHFKFLDATMTHGSDERQERLDLIESSQTKRPGLLPSTESHEIDTHVDLSIVIPAYNEEGGIAATIEEIRSAIAPLGIRYNIIVSNDGSTDQTAARAGECGVCTVSVAENVGYGAALKRGILAGASNYVAIIDADGTYPASALPAMFDLARHADMVVGARNAAMTNVALIRRPAKRIIGLLANYLTRTHIPDINSGLRVFRRSSLVRFLPLLPKKFSFTTTITLCMICSDLVVVYEPIDYRRRIGRSKIRMSDFFSFMLLIFRTVVLFNPLRVFLPIGSALFLLGLVKLAYDVVIGDLSETAIFGFLSAIMLWSLGLVADMIARLHLRS